MRIRRLPRSSVRRASTHISVVWLMTTILATFGGIASASTGPHGLRSAVHTTLRVPVSPGGRVAQRAELTASDGASGDKFGAAIAIDRNTVVVGAGGKNSTTGAAFVFVLSGGVWSQQAELTASDGASGDAFGYSVAISGSTIVVGAPFGNSSTGAAYVFVGSGGIWSQQAKLTAADGAAGDYFGRSVAVSGSTALVGAPDKRSNTGAAYVFVGSGGIWSQRAKLTASDGVRNSLFAESVAVTGSTAVLGAGGRDSGTGAAYVFVRSGGTWSQQADLTASDATKGESFGESAALSGSTAVVGAPTQPFGTSTGAAYVFVGSGGIWSQQAKLTGSDGATGDLFGSSVAVSGTTAVVGAFGKSSSMGAAYVFVASGTVWTQQAELTASDGAGGDDFGYSMGISRSTLVVGAPTKNLTTGAVYVFVKV
jgi:hypothetical protein